MMGVFLKAAAGVLVGLILWIFLDRHNKDVSLLLTLAVCTFAMIIGSYFIEPVIRFLQKIGNVGQLDKDLLSVLLRTVGIGLISEICASICSDAGNAAMGKALQMVSSVVILWLSIPVFEKLLSLLDKILGKV